MKYPPRVVTKPRSDSRSWFSEAACVGEDTNDFFPEDLPNRSQEDKAFIELHVRATLKICASCPVRAECLDYGLEDEYGIFGGLLPEQRRTLRNHRNRKGSNN